VLVLVGGAGEGGVSGMRIAVVCLWGLGRSAIMVLGGIYVVCFGRTIFGLVPVWGWCGRRNVMALMVAVLVCGVQDGVRQG
jgi:hypothetical protein